MVIGSNTVHTKNGHSRGEIGILEEKICTRKINNYFIKHLKVKIEVIFKPLIRSCYKSK